MFLKQNSLHFVSFILLLGAQITLVLSSDSLKDSDVDVVVDDGSFSHARTLASFSLSCLSYCTDYGDVRDDSVNYFTISMASYSTATLYIKVGEPTRDVTVSLSSSVTTLTMSTDIKLWPDNSYPYNYVNTIYGTGWSSTFSIGKSPFSSRELDIEIGNGPYFTTVTFKIEVTGGGSSINLAWLIPVIIVGVVAIIVGVAIWIIQKRRRRATTIRNTTVQQVQLSNNQNISSVPYQPAPQSYPITTQPMQVQYQQYPVYTPGIPQNTVYQDVGPLSAMNFETRFPEMLAQNILNLNPSSICALCYKDFQLNPRCRQLYCGHIFHGECIKPWLLNQMQISNCATCPGCNSNMTYLG